MAKKKKQCSNLVGWAILGAIGVGIFQFGVLGEPQQSAARPQRSIASQPASKPATTVPLDAPRFVNVASLNVRHAPDLSAPMITALAEGTPLRVLGRENGWLLVDLGPTLEGWVAERLTTTNRPQARAVPPAAVR